jgi:hypothetical protein
VIKMWLKKNKRAQIAQTLSWTVATLIIIAVLIISLFVTTIIVKAKTVTNFINNLFGGNNNYVKIADLFAQKSLDSYLFTNKNGIIYEQIKTDGTLNDIDANLAKNIFPKFYGVVYRIIWLGVQKSDGNIIPNKYFKVPICGMGISQQIKLNAERFLLLTLTTNC